MWRSIFLLFGFFVLGFIAGSMSWINWNWKVGLNVFAVFSCFGIISAVANLFTIKRISNIDIFLPIPLAIFWAIILLPFEISSLFFSAGTLIGAAFMLSISKRCLTTIF